MDEDPAPGPGRVVGTGVVMLVLVLAGSALVRATGWAPGPVVGVLALLGGVAVLVIGLVRASRRDVGRRDG